MSKRVKKAMHKYMGDWESHANAGWRYGKWLDLEDSISKKLALVLRADAEDVGIAASLSAGMHSLMATFYKPTSTRNKIIMLSSEFTSDILVSESWLDIH
jgi:kynureninase